MPIISSSYLNSVIARVPEELYTDKEGIHLLSELASNMAWMMKSLQTAKSNAIHPPEIKRKYYLQHLFTD